MGAASETPAVRGLKRKSSDPGSAMRDSGTVPPGLECRTDPIQRTERRKRSGRSRSESPFERGQHRYLSARSAASSQSGGDGSETHRNTDLLAEHRPVGVDVEARDGQVGDVPDPSRVHGMTGEPPRRFRASRDLGPQVRRLAGRFANP